MPTFDRTHGTTSAPSDADARLDLGELALRRGERDLEIAALGAAREVHERSDAARARHAQRQVEGRGGHLGVDVELGDAQRSERILLRPGDAGVRALHGPRRPERERDGAEAQREHEHGGIAQGERSS